MLSHFSHVRLFAILWTVACQASLSMEFSRQEYWSGLPGPPPGESSQPRDQTRVSCISCIAGNSHLGSPVEAVLVFFNQILPQSQPPASAEDIRDLGSIPGLERSPGEGNGHPLQYSCLENPMDRGA